MSVSRCRVFSSFRRNPERKPRTALASEVHAAVSHFPVSAWAEMERQGRTVPAKGCGIRATIRYDFREPWVALQNRTRVSRQGTPVKPSLHFGSHCPGRPDQLAVFGLSSGRFLRVVESGVFADGSVVEVGSFDRQRT